MLDGSSMGVRYGSPSLVHGPAYLVEERDTSVCFLRPRGLRPSCSSVIYLWTGLMYTFAAPVVASMECVKRCVHVHVFFLSPYFCPASAVARVTWRCVPQCFDPCFI